MKNTLTVEQQQIIIEESLTVETLMSNLKRTPMYTLSSQQQFDLHSGFVMMPRDSLIFEPIHVQFCNECSCKFDVDIDSCTNAECLNCDIYENPYDDFCSAYA